MEKYIALLRGINVGGHRKILMADLRAVLTKEGFHDISTYIQSGNLLFSKEKESIPSLESALKQIIYNHFGFDVPVIVRRAKAWKKIASQNPFLDANPDLDIKTLLVTFLAEKPGKENLLHFTQIPFENDAYEIRGKEIYIHCTIGYSKTKLTNQLFEKKLKSSATTRNWKTVLKLAALADA